MQILRSVETVKQGESERGRERERERERESERVCVREIERDIGREHGDTEIYNFAKQC